MQIKDYLNLKDSFKLLILTSEGHNKGQQMENI